VKLSRDVPNYIKLETKTYLNNYILQCICPI